MRRYLVVCSLLALSLVVSPQVDADILYGVNAEDDGLSTYDVSTGQPSFIGSLGSEFDTPIGLDIDPATGTFYGWNNSGDGTGLVTINPATGAGSLAGSNFTEMTSISFDGAGTLYGFGSNFEVHQINLDGTIANSVSLSESILVTGADFDSNGVLYGLASINGDLSLYTIDPLTGQILTTLNLGVDGFSGGLAFNSAGELYGFRINDSGGFMFQIDPVTGAISNSFGLDGFAAQGAAFSTAIPEPSTAGLTGLAGLFSLALRRRRRNQNAI